MCDWGILFQYHLSSTHIEGCEGWWSSGCCGSVAENWWLKPEVSWVRLPETATFLTFLYFRLITSKFFVISKTMPEFNYYNPEVHDATTCYCDTMINTMSISQYLITLVFWISMGSHLYVASWSVCVRDQDFWAAKSVLDCPFKSSWQLDFLWSKVKLEPHVLDSLILTVLR